MIGLALWSAYRFAARAVFELTPRTRRQRAAIDRLRNDIKHASAVPIGQSAKFWADKQRRLRELILTKDPRAFLTWSVIGDTMFPAPYASFARAELHVLRQSFNWRAWRSVIREQTAGLPLPCLYYPFSSSNAIHQAYHLYRFEAESGLRIRDFGTILEFGGGYGALCRIAHRVGFSGRYVIFDFPEQGALQRYYLDSVGVPNVTTVSDISALSNALESSSRTPKLFLAAWSLSETPLELRKPIAVALHTFDAFLIAFQTQFESVNNISAFVEWQTWFPTVKWTFLEIYHLPGNTYLLGVASNKR